MPTATRWAWPMAWLTEMEGLAQPARFPWLLFRVARALSRFTTHPDEGMVVASTVGHRDHVAMETVGCMVATVLYRWRGDMGWEEWLEHVITVQGQCEVPLEALRLPLHPESHTPLTPVMADLALQRAAPPPPKKSPAAYLLLSLSKLRVARSARFPISSHCPAHY